MVAFNWDAFTQLPGSVEINFEKLARALIRRHYGQFGDFRELANQAGVEFHLKLHTKCSLGEPGRWYGWQCKWYGIQSGTAIGTTRRTKIIEGLNKSRATLPDLTDWVLWTRHKLTKGDQEWFYGLQADYPFNLSLHTADDIEALLVGPGTLLRESYFGELVLTPEGLAEQHAIAVAPVTWKFQPEVHQVAQAETTLSRYLGGKEAWEVLPELAVAIKKRAEEIHREIPVLPESVRAATSEFVSYAQSASEALKTLQAALAHGELDEILRAAEAGISSPAIHRRSLAKLRSARVAEALTGANLLADLFYSASEIKSLQRAVQVDAVAVLAPAGVGKSELAIKLTLPEGEFPGGVLFLGSSLHAGQTLDNLVAGFKIAGKPVASFERLLEAVDAAGQRAGRRIPIVIDGLNEAEDTRKWKELLASAKIQLKRSRYVLLVVTLRSEFAEECLPQGFERVELEGFRSNLEALKRYFSFYRIDATDAEIPREPLEHPLTLRVYCEVANPTRERTVGVEALPSSLTTLFSRYLEDVATRVADRSPVARRICRDEVLEALTLVGKLLWQANKRDIDFKELRKELQETGWDASLVRSLESEGILVRGGSGGSGQRISVVVDLIAGQLIAEYLLERDDIVEWLGSAENAAKLNSLDRANRHAFASDTFRALADLFPKRTHRRALWQVVHSQLRGHALYLSAQTDPAYINPETVETMSQAMLVDVSFAKAVFSKLRVTRAALAHPFDALFQDRVLRGMSMAHRDLSWSEWLRAESEDVVLDLEALKDRWQAGQIEHREMMRARWVMWTLTSTVRNLRDIATRTLFALAVRLPAEFYELMLESLSVQDPYVPERMCAAGYGVALSSWADPASPSMATALPKVARALWEKMFSSSAAHPTRHALLRQYCLGIIELARRIDPACISGQQASDLVAPFAQLPAPFPSASKFTDQQIEDADTAGIGMDFGNYTIGSIVPGRSNYDFKNADYASTRREIVVRMLRLGYEPEKFQPIDSTLTSSSRTGNDPQKIDRYGKKYSWIAFFEMWGWRADNGLLSKWDDEHRPSQADIDPTFPSKARTWNPTLPDLFEGRPTGLAEWMKKGPTPDYGEVLRVSGLDGVEGDWLLLDGFIDETAVRDYRNVFSFLRGLLVKEHDVPQLVENLSSMEYPGNRAIPDNPSHHYTYAGEMPFGGPLGALRTQGSTVLGQREEISHPTQADCEISVEMPVHAYAWESYHSQLNDAGGADMPSPNLCQFLGLQYSSGSVDLRDVLGIASLTRDIGGDSTTLNGQATYLRADLLRRYLAATEQKLVWMVWGERGRHYRGGTDHDEDMREVFTGYKHIHKTCIVWDATPNTADAGKPKRKPRTGARKSKRREL